MIIKAITLWQPWASFMAIGLKKNETRSWSTDYRGPLAIHAALKVPTGTRSEGPYIPFDVYELASKHFGNWRGWPVGKILCVVDLLNCRKSDGVITDPSSIETMLGGYSKGRFIWETKTIQVFNEPIPCKGHQGLWEWDWQQGSE